MTISSIADYRAAALQQTLYSKSAVSWGGQYWYGNLRIGGSPGDAGAPANNTAGTVPTGGATGFPTIADTGGDMYVTAVEASLLSSNSLFIGYRYILADLLWYAGAYAPSANVSLSSQPSFIARIPNGDYKGTQLWSIGSGGSPTGGTTLTVTYTNHAGATGKSTPATNINAAASNVGLQAQQFALADGDLGIQKVESVVGNGVGSYSANLVVVRPLVYGRVQWGKPPRRVWLDGTGMPLVYPTSALMTFVWCEGSNNGSVLTTVPMELSIELASKLYTGASGVTWSASDYIGNIAPTLTNGDLTIAQGVSGTGYEDRATVGRASGKYYWEVQINVGPASSEPFIGIHTSAAMTGNHGPFGSGLDYGVFMRSPNDGHQPYQPGGNFPAVGPAVATSHVFMFAADLNNRKFWTGRNGTWDNSGNPSTGTGGATITAGQTWYPWTSGSGSTQTQVTARFEIASWGYTCPSGFEPWH